MSLQDIIKEKKEWREHMARVKALPRDYQIVYGEIQKYLFKIGIWEDTDRTEVFTDLVDLFEDGAAHGKGVLEVTGSDVAAFCDGLWDNSKPSYLDKVDEAVSAAMKKAENKMK